MKRLRKLAKAFRAAIDVLFFCRHTKQTWPQKDKRGAYVRCLRCGRRIPWAWKEQGTEPRRLKLPILKLTKKDKAAEELERMVRGDGKSGKS